MSQPAKKRTGKYDYLLAMRVGETIEFPNKPTRSEAIRKVKPSHRSAYKCISNGLWQLRTKNPDYAFSLTITQSRGSRIDGDLLLVKLLKIGDNVADMGAFERYESHRQQATEAWKKRKQAEDAPKLPGQIEEAREQDLARRTAGAVKRQMEEKGLSVVTNRYDPKRIAALVAASIAGEVIERFVDDRWLIDPQPTWTEPTAMYRIKPKIREWFMVLGRDNRVTAISESITTLPHHDPACRVLVREVLGEDE